MKKFFPFILLLLLMSLKACSPSLEKPYVLSKETEEQLLTFKNKDKFSKQSWDQRGLMPSPPNVIFQMNNSIHNTVDQILSSKQTLTENNIKKIIRLEMEKVKMLDTEEREFMGDVFFELSTILNINCQEEINDFMY